MDRRENLRADLDVGIQFFTDLAREALLERFAGVPFAAGELPVTGEMGAVEPAREQERPIPLDDRCRHDDLLAPGHLGAGPSWRGSKG